MGLPTRGADPAYVGAVTPLTALRNAAPDRNAWDANWNANHPGLPIVGVAVPPPPAIVGGGSVSPGRPGPAASTAAPMTVPGGRAARQSLSADLLSLFGSPDNERKQLLGQ